MTRNGDAHGGRTDGTEGVAQAELDVLGGLLEGLDDREIAARLSLPLGTVKAHLRELRRKVSLFGRDFGGSPVPPGYEISPWPADLCRLILLEIEKRFVEAMVDAIGQIGETPTLPRLAERIRYERQIGDMIPAVRELRRRTERERALLAARIERRRLDGEAARRRAPEEWQAPRLDVLVRRLADFVWEAAGKTPAPAQEAILNCVRDTVTVELDYRRRVRAYEQRLAEQLHRSIGT